MTKTFRLIAFALSACAIGLTSCNQNEVVSTQVVENLSPVKTILSATVPGGSKTRINIDDQGNNGLIVTWEEGDILIAYKDGVKAAIFHYTGENGAGTGTFEAETNNALRGDYTLIYTTLPAEDHEENIDDMRQKIKTTPVTQNGYSNIRMIIKYILYYGRNVENVFQWSKRVLRLATEYISSS